jgi:hypothetical protein
MRIGSCEVGFTFNEFLDSNTNTSQKMKIYMNQNRHMTREETALSHLKAETYVQKVSFPFLNLNSTLMFKFIADIDEASPSEDEEAAQRALHGENGAEGGDLHPDGSSFISIFKYQVYAHVQVHCRYR